MHIYIEITSRENLIAHIYSRIRVSFNDAHVPIFITPCKASSDPKWKNLSHKKVNTQDGEKMIASIDSLVWTPTTQTQRKGSQEMFTYQDEKERESCTTSGQLACIQWIEQDVSKHWNTLYACKKLIISNYEIECRRGREEALRG